MDPHATEGSGYEVRITNRRGVMPDLQSVSPSRGRYDRVIKLGWYLSIGVPEHPRRLQRYVLGPDGYVLRDALAGDVTFTPSSFPGLAIPRSELWRG